MTSESRATAKAYPTPAQYERWKARADELDMSISEFIQSMVEAGMKVDRGFEITSHRDETIAELREQRAALKQERDELRKRLEKTRDRLADREREAVREHVVDESPGGADFESIVGHVRETAPGRVTTHLDALDGDELHRNPNDGRWFATAEESQ